MRHRIQAHRRRIRRLRRLNQIWMRRLAGNDRTQLLNRTLGAVLALVAGMMNAGGFLILRQYTSHMTGTVSSLADMAFLKDWSMLFRGCGVLIFFILGAMFTTLMVVIGKHHDRHSQYALPLSIEAILLVVFSFIGFFSRCAASDCLYPLIFLLSFVMGMQNAVITKISNSEVRTTHVTGTVTDIGIGMARWMLLQHSHLHSSVQFNVSRLRFNCILVSAFMGGGIIGAWGFSVVGFYFCFLPVTLLVWVSFMPVWLDIYHLLKKEPSIEMAHQRSDIRR